MTQVFAIVGDPIEQVRSPEVFNGLFREHRVDAVMVPMQVKAEDLEASLNELRGKVGDGVNQAADFILAASSIPSLNFTPSMTFDNWF
jgi:shikimate 5-dehydrogenase